MKWLKRENYGPAEVFINEENRLLVLRSTEGGYLHLSISHPERYPTWEEIKEARYDLLPNECTVGILLPPKEEYVNIHPNCFHLHEVKAGRIVLA